MYDLLARWGVTPKVRAEVHDVELARRLAREGYGIAPLNTHTLSRNIPAGGLVALRMTSPVEIHEPVYLVTRRRRWPNPLAAHLVTSFRIRFTWPALRNAGRVGGKRQRKSTGAGR
jgi:DNA-binding transcriptional LysR family regulator